MTRMAKNRDDDCDIYGAPELRPSSAREVRALLTAGQRIALARAVRVLADPMAIPPRVSEAYGVIEKLSVALKGSEPEAPTAWSGTLDDALEGAVDVLQRVGKEKAREALLRAGLDG